MKSDRLFYPEVTTSIGKGGINMRRAGIILVLVLSCVFSGCSGGSAEKYRVTLDMSGAVTETVKEDFNQDTYDKEELKDTIDNAINQYNTQAGDTRIELDTYKVGGDVAQVTITYAADDDYETFNNEDLYNGNLTDVVLAKGYDANVLLTNRQGETTTLKSLLDSKDGKHRYAAVISEDCNLRTSGRILYASSNVKITARKAADVTLAEGEFAFVVYE